MGYRGNLNDFANQQLTGHIIFPYESLQEHINVLAPFLLQGLRRRARVIYVVDIHPSQEILSYLWRKGVNPELYLASGQLMILNRFETYIQQDVFNPDRMLVLVQTEIDRARREGYSGLVATGEMTWALRGYPGSDRLIEYELKLNEILNQGCLCLCQYHRHHFDSKLIEEALAVHPLIMVGNKIFDNPNFLTARACQTH
ncbi:MAG: MEDS domain-containing protein [Desulfobacteraceae bacterium]